MATPYKFEQCHIGPIHVLTIGKAKVYAGRHTDMQYGKNWDLRLRMVDNDWQRSETDVTYRFGAEAMVDPDMAITPPPPTIDIDWPDFSVPLLTRKWWYGLIKTINTLGETKEDFKVGAYCSGGHGRTGTALSILVALSGAIKEDEDPVEVIRKIYCDDAVESTAQITYIERITGFTVKEEPNYGTALGTPYGSSTTTVPSWAGSDLPYGSYHNGVWVPGTNTTGYSAPKRKVKPAPKLPMLMPEQKPPTVTSAVRRVFDEEIKGKNLTKEERKAIWAKAQVRLTALVSEETAGSEKAAPVEATATPV